MNDTAQLAARDPTTTRFEATVTGIDGRSVTLSDSYFYAESGGQPGDRGTVDGVPVTDVQSNDGHVHHLAEDPRFGVGDRVDCAIDEAFRTYCMRAHTASHALYGAGRRTLTDLGYGGFGITEEKVRVDFTTATEIDDDVLVDLERLVNRVVWDAREVSWETVATEEAYDREEVAFNAKTEEGVMGESDSVRVVTIRDWDWAACGGTHVSNTAEIGPVTVLDRSNPGEGLTRVEFAVGPAAIDRRTRERRALLSAGQKADVAFEDLADAVERLTDERNRFRDEVEELRGRLLSSRVDELAEDAFEWSGHRMVAGTVDGVGPNEAADPAREAAGDVADVVVLIGVDGSTFLAVGADPEAGADAGAVIESVTEAFGGGGGGSPRFAQGGGLEADPEAVVSFLRE
jgi:alanyl-tRNA synthetase